MFSRWKHHARLLLHALGRRRRIGTGTYQMQGYFPNRLCADDHHEPHLRGVIQRLLADRDGAFLDVGVNTGQTLLKVLACDPQRRYVGFEPQIACCFFVSEFLRRNQIRTAQVLPIGLGADACVLQLHVHGDVDEMASLDDFGLRASDDHSSVPILVLRGDTVLQQLQIDRVAVLKVDVEGAELEVMRGLEETIRRCRPAILFEVLPNYSGHERSPIPADAAARHRTRAAELMHLLQELGYRIEQVQRDGTLQPIAELDLDDPAAFVGSDYVALPADSVPN